jgi:hypothetical protein
MPDFLYHWPLWIGLTLIVVALIVVAQVSLFLVRRFMKPMRFTHEEAHYGTAILHSMLVVYGLIAALIAINVYEVYAEVAKTVSREAASIATLWRDSASYPEPVRTGIRSAIREYTHQIITEAWPQQRKGITPRGGVAMVDSIQQKLHAFVPADDQQEILHAETLRAANEMFLARRLRVDANREHLPDVMWRLLLFGAVLCMFAACLFEVENVKLHRLSISLLATLTAIVLFMIFAWDRPYLGEFGVESEAYELIYNQLMQP